ncbi:MAG: C40 family peptidase [Bacteroidales bacterium]|nr:C40 family peptidase [Bacteroidales bacterium]
MKEIIRQLIPMDKGISFQGFVPMRRDRSESSEMISQVLFGEKFRILASDGGWLQISLDFDGYEGWVDKDSVQLIGSVDEAVNGSRERSRIVSAPSIAVLDVHWARQLILPAGSQWPETTGKGVSLHGREFELLSAGGLNETGQVDPELIGNGLLSIPLLQGGRCGFGFDSSGLVQTLCRMMGVALPRESSQQAELGATINFMHEIQKGDLAFFDNAEGNINHVGLVLDDGRILHVHDQVRIDRLDQQGIYCAEREDYTHKLRIIKRIGD